MITLFNPCIVFRMQNLKLREVPIHCTRKCYVLSSGMLPVELGTVEMVVLVYVEANSMYCYVKWRSLFKCDCRRAHNLLGVTLWIQPHLVKPGRLI
jgi:hypothetical protein